MTAPFGYFGKIPAQPDFVFQGLSVRTTDAWAVQMSGWLVAGRKTAQRDWTRRFLTSPVWRFILPKGLIGADGWVGLLAGSADSIGREFPFTVMMAADIDPGDVQPMLALDAGLDHVEGEMLAFMEGDIRQAELMKVLGEASLAIASEAGDLDGASARIAPGEQEDAICLSGSPAAARTGRYDAAWSWPMARSDKPAGKLCLWWHEGTADRAAELCVSRGIPARAGAAAFFLGDWQACGWTARSPADYRLG